MRCSTKVFVRTAGLLALAVTFAAPIAAADDTKQPSPPAKGTPGGPGLGGPRVPPEGVKGNERFDNGEKGKGAERQRKAPPQLWFGTLKQMTLTDAQKASIDPLVAEWQKSEEAFRTENGPKLKELEEKRKAEAKANGKASEETMKAIGEINAKRPKPEPIEEKIFALLNAEQQKEFKAKLEAGMARGRGEGQGRGPKRDGENPPKRGNGAGRGTGGAGGGTGGGSGGTGGNGTK